MKKCSNCLLYKTFIEFSKDVSKRDNKQSRCKDCSKTRGKEYRKNNKKYFVDYMYKWVRDNNHIVNKIAAKRRAVKLKATITLTSLQKDQIKCIYSRAKEMTSLTGIKFQVDHIVPLQGKNVSGLHVPWNLRIVTEVYNKIKGNRYG